MVLRHTEKESEIKFVNFEKNKKSAIPMRPTKIVAGQPNLVAVVG
jgi:hypothetical protein